MPIPVSETDKFIIRFLTEIEGDKVVIQSQIVIAHVPVNIAQVSGSPDL
jgi:hypothetical protein